MISRRHPAPDQIDAFLDHLAAWSGDGAERVASDPAEWSAHAAVRVLRTGSLRAEDYASALLVRVIARPGLNAFRSLDPGLLLASARAADLQRAAGRSTGLLHGLPIPVKDSVDSAALPTSNGTAALRDFQPAEDAVLLRRLFAAGALLMGKTNLHELSYGWTSNNATFGPVRNPWNSAHVAGGSSGGSAAAVAARMAPLAVAEDTQGSIRVPAAMCGLAGLRPSFGRYPGAGLMALTLDRFDQAGPLARNVADLLLFDAAITGDLRPVTVPRLADVRIGVCRALMLRGLDPDTSAGVEAALQTLAQAGVTLVEIDLRTLVLTAMELAMVIIASETEPAMTAYLARSASGLDFSTLVAQAGPDVRDMLLEIALPPGRPDPASHRVALIRLRELVTALDALYVAFGLDAIAFPPAMCVAPRVGEDDEVRIGARRMPLGVAMARNTSLGSCASLASLVLPVGLGPAGLPVGIEFAAPNGCDRELLGLGFALEQILGQLPAPPTGA